jgi:glycerol-3-phosphate dehydrogenase (NAD(P)+)
MKVGIVGGGRWGQALARLVMAAGNEPFIAYQGKRPPHILPSTDDPPQVAAECELLLVATSAAEVRASIRLVKPGPQNMIVVAGRGLDPVTGDWLTDAVLQECDTVRVGALAGPAPVEEILNGGLCAGLIASRDEALRQMAVTALHSPRYRCYETPDLTGVQLAGAVVPVLAALVGLALNLGGAGVGIHAMVLTRGLAEATRLGNAIGADPATFMGLAGVGDLVAAQARPGHPHYDVGKALASGHPPQGSGPEHLARALLKLAQMHGVDAPLISAIVGICDGLPPVDAVQRLMMREAKVETR